MLFFESVQVHPVEDCKRWEQGRFRPNTRPQPSAIVTSVATISLFGVAFIPHQPTASSCRAPDDTFICS